MLNIGYMTELQDVHQYQLNSAKRSTPQKYYSASVLRILWIVCLEEEECRTDHLSTVMRCGGFASYGTLKLHYGLRL